MLKDPGSNFNPMYTEKTVVNVVSKDVCDMICTLSEISQVVNAWAFDYGSGTCTCTWLTSLTCDLESVESADENSGLTVAYIQYAKTLPCSKSIAFIKKIIFHPKEFCKVAKLCTTSFCLKSPTDSRTKLFPCQAGIVKKSVLLASIALPFLGIKQVSCLI